MTDAKTEGERMSAEPDRVTFHKLGRDLELLTDDIGSEMNLRGYACVECDERIYPFDGKPSKPCCASFVDQVRKLLSDEVEQLRDVYRRGMRSTPKRETCDCGRDVSHDGGVMCSECIDGVAEHRLSERAEEEIKKDDLGKCDTCDEPATVIITRFVRQVGPTHVFENINPADNRERVCHKHTPKEFR